MEDLLEEVVGEIEDEHDVREELARVTSPRTLVASARRSVSPISTTASVSSFLKPVSMLRLAGLWSNGSAIFPNPANSSRPVS